MSEYCYQCDGCGEFREQCRCSDGFKDPMAYWKSLSDRDLLMEMREEFKE